jgi:O-Antigen ligase
MLRRLASYAERVEMPPSLATSQVSSLEPTARRFALVALALIYSGAERYFPSVWRPLHYGFDLVLVAAIALLLIAAPSRGVLRVVPYGLWICLYYAWGVAVAPNRSTVWSTAASDLILNGLILSAVALAVRSRSDVSSLASYVQVAVTTNLVFALMQAIDWHILVAMANVLNSSTYNIYRPAGMWIDPNVAGISYLFGFLLSLLVQDRRALAWLGRAGATVGILLTGSREAMYPLLVCWAIVTLMAVYRHPTMLRRVAKSRVPAGVLATIVAVALGAALIAWFSPIRDAVGYNLHRFLDASARGPAEPSRLQLATYWLDRAIHGPWYGTGVFSFQGNGRTVFGAHNIYLTTWGEVGVPLLAVYLAVLAVGFIWMTRARIPIADRVTLAMMWAAYLVLGFTGHNQFSVVESIVVVGLLYTVPAALNTATTATHLRIDPALPHQTRATSEG